ncbi:MAG: arsenite methyltransferase [Candidatus Hydrogenedentales bacterium]
MNQTEAIRVKVRANYAAIAERGPSNRANEESAGGCCAPATSSCCGSASSTTNHLAQAIGYDAAELAALPEGANLGLSCGNPVALAGLKAGEVVVDLGSGAGFDIFIAGKKVGEKGRAIGVDMTPEMLGRARQNVEVYRERSGLENVEFRLGEIEHLPIADNVADVVISNCVINLAPDKPQVWREIARILKPHGRVAVSDLALLRPLPAGVSEMVEALVGCIAGASLVSDIERMARDAGLDDVQLIQKPGNIDAMINSNDDFYQKVLSALPADTRPSDYVVSLEIRATKAAPVACCGLDAWKGATV